MNKHNNRIIIILFFLVGIIGFGSQAFATTYHHDPIFINGNSQFTLANGVSGGSGTVGDPYIIENWIIDDSGASEVNGITILNTTAYFTIRNCVLENGGDYAGIYLNNVINGRIENNTLSYNYYCIELYSSDYNTFTGNTLSNNTEGFYLNSSDYNTVDNNTVSITDDANIWLVSSDNNNITNNFLGDGFTGVAGVELMLSNSNTVNNNIINNLSNGIYLSVSPSNSNTVTNNTIKNCSRSFYLVSGSNSNTITLNHSLNSALLSSDLGTNNWDSGGRGNYWDDWQPPAHPDSDNNGIVDNPRLIAGGTNQDNYPLVDVTGPTCSISSISESSIYGYASGSTIYYNTVSSGSFTVDVSAGDTESGVFKVNFPATVSAGGDDTDSPYAFIYDWDTSDTFSQSSNITCYDNMNNTQTASFTVTRDVTAPSGGTISYTAGIYTSRSVPITYTLGSDSGSDLDTSTGKIQRREATSSGGICGTFGDWSDLVTEFDGSYTDNTVSFGKCYQYHYLVSDNVSNQTIYASTNIATIGAPPDTDSDGMPDSWETDNELDPFDPADASQDADNDGWTNLQEYLLDYDPNDASPNKPVGISPPNDSVNVSLTPTLEGSPYSDTDLDPHLFTEWQVASDIGFSEIVFTDTSAINKQTIPISLAILKPETTYFWRVCYFDGEWSQWSEPLQFQTESLDDFLADNEGIEVIDIITKDKGTVVLSFKQNPNNLPDLPSGYQFYNDIFSFRIEDIIPGDTVLVTFQLDEPFQQDHKWFKYYPYFGEWDDTYATHIVSGIGTNQITLEFKDGGFGDIDGVENGVIVDPSGPAIGISSDDDEKDYCFIATACYGTAMASEVRVLSQFRDRYLLTNPIGEGFVKTYYKVSPAVADFIREHPILKKAVRNALKPVIWLSQKSVS